MECLPDKLPIVPLTSNHISGYIAPIASIEQPPPKLLLLFPLLLDSLQTPGHHPQNAHGKLLLTVHITPHQLKHLLSKVDFE